MSNAKAIGTPMSPSTSLDKDEQRKSVDETKYRGMIGSLIYLNASRPDIMFSVCKCARFQSAPKESHLTAVKRIIRYLIGIVSHGLWYPRSNMFKLEGFTNADLAGDKEDRKSTREKALGKRPMEDSPISSTPKKPKIDISISIESDLNFWDSPNMDIFIALKDKPIAHGSIVDLDDMEAQNCKCKCYAFPMFFKNTWPDDFEISFDQAKRCIAESSSKSLPNQLGPTDVSF
uniref:Uncharacterized protein LOC104249002 n=1 Tax=Nicotiana sylvestris TaxID=4096 RepID=A0A1U7YWW1_NICSY|nr:PREDICTED: uncharacterized protein LOC104249002 [Nicotiana sylvestris]